MTSCGGPIDCAGPAMTALPQRQYDDPAAYMADYAALTVAGWRTIEPAALRRASDTLLTAYRERRQVFVCGNGGSATISAHFECDHLKGVHTGTDLAPRIRTLASNTGLLTAIANDLSYDEVFAFPLARLADPGDVLLAISASGNSRNIVKAIEHGNVRGLTTIAFTGFDGGKAREIAQISVHVGVCNYGIVEDLHQGLMHVLAQYIRQSRMTADRIPAVRF
jgi:D-sedoheptulose 7-phosphate isomerase